MVGHTSLKLKREDWSRGRNFGVVGISTIHKTMLLLRSLRQKMSFEMRNDKMQSLFTITINVRSRKSLWK